jgi:hypothetical protein
MLKNVKCLDIYNKNKYMEYIKKFNSISDYDDFIDGVDTGYKKPNVSWCVQENVVMYDKWEFEGTTAIYTVPSSDGRVRVQIAYFDERQSSEVHYGYTGTVTVDGEPYQIGETPLQLISVNHVSAQMYSGERIVKYPSISQSVSNVSHFLSGCELLTSVKIAKTYNIVDYAFENCTGLTTVEMDENVTNIGAKAFYGCTSLTSIICKAEIPPTLGTDAGGRGTTVFDNTNNCPIYVPSEYLQTYKQRWSRYSSRIVAL